MFGFNLLRGGLLRGFVIVFKRRDWWTMLRGRLGICVDNGR